MFAIELSTSIDWAREMRGTASIASAVTPRAASLSRSSGLSAGASRPTTVDPGRSSAISSSVGALTLNTMSVDHASPTLAPASTYAWSVKLAFTPASCSRTTS
jgi:hypothetical protein